MVAGLSKMDAEGNTKNIYIHSECVCRSFVLNCGIFAFITLPPPPPPFLIFNAQQEIHGTVHSSELFDSYDSTAGAGASVRASVCASI